MVATELVGAGNVDDQMPVTADVGILDEQVSATRLAVGLPHQRNVATLCGQARFTADLRRMPTRRSWMPCSRSAMDLA